MMGLAGAGVSIWKLSWADVSRGLHGHGAHHTMVLMALTMASGLLAPLVSPLSQGLFAGALLSICIPLALL